MVEACVLERGVVVGARASERAAVKERCLARRCRVLRCARNRGARAAASMRLYLDDHDALLRRAAAHGRARGERWARKLHPCLELSVWGVCRRCVREGWRARWCECSTA